MLRVLTERLDRLAIWSACSSIAPEPDGPSRLGEAQALLAEPTFLGSGNSAPLTFRGQRAFEFTSPVATPWFENNRVHGRLYRCRSDWQAKPSVVLLHGWNGEAGYEWQFPYLAWRLNRAGVNAAMIELPYHGQRRPWQPGAPRNFFSHDLLSVAQAVQQSIADARALIGWLREQGSPQVGVWGVSLGAWLSGLLATCDPYLAFAVLLTPVVRMDRAFEELQFCEPIRRGLGGSKVPLDFFNLISHRPLIPANQMLIVKSEYDLFAPSETVEELWQAWGQSPIWRTRHGHISVLMSLPILERIVSWCAGAAEGRG
jgi:dienelactone hydrolase